MIALLTGLAHAADGHAAPPAGSVDATAIATEILLLLLIGSLVALVARTLKLPYTLALVVAGIGLGFVHLEALDAFELDAGTLFVFLLPALLFEAAFHLNVESFRKNAGPILTFAGLGTVVAVLVTASASYGLLAATGLRELPWSHAFLFAAIIAATDPISVLALFKEAGVDKRLYVIVEGESLLNDGLAVVAFLIVGAVFAVDVGHGHAPELHGTSEAVVYGIRTFVGLAGGGVLVGLVVGGVGTFLTRQFDDHLVEIVLTAVVAYGSFLIAEHGLHVNGVLATVTAGMVVGTYGTEVGMSTPTRIAVEDFWETMAFVANTFVFLLVGLEIRITDLAADALPIGAGFLAVLIARAVTVYGLWPLATRGTTIPGAWSHVLVWGGLKGSLSMVLVLGLSPELEGRDALVRLVFGVVAASLFVQGLSMSPLLARLGLVTKHTPEELAFEREIGVVLGARHALAHLDAERHEGAIDPVTHEALSVFYGARRDAGEAAASAGLAGVGRDLGKARLIDAALTALVQERSAIRHAIHDGTLSREAGAAVLRETDERLAALRRGDLDAGLPRGPAPRP